MSRTARVQRSTAETRITLSLDLDGTGTTTIATGLGFFDHMLTHIGKHGRLDLTLAAEGDLHVDEHHLIEDVGLAFGRALFEALGEKRGIERFGVGFITLCFLESSRARWSTGFRRKWHGNSSRRLRTKPR